MRSAFLITGALLVIAYVATSAPSVTLWDAGEFLSSIHALGIPHPPGTPLFVFVASVWARLVGFVPFAAAANAASGAAAATACAALAWLVARWTRSLSAGVASGLIAGTMAVTWQSATETEVYSYALALSAVMLVVGEIAGGRSSPRHRLLLAFLFGLAAPLHLSALVAGPAAVLLASTDVGGRLSMRAALGPTGAWILAAGIGTVSALPIVSGVMLGLCGAVLPAVEARRARLVRAIASLTLVVGGASFLLVLPVRARHDPAVNQGNPRSWAALVEVVGRRQYDVPPLWPRRAPFWLQVGNVVQYADWQVASALSDAPGPSPWRTPFTILFVALGVVGGATHLRVDRRSWIAMTALFVAATVGVVVVLNLRAGPSFGWGVLPDGAIREARERDYFFALGFAVWGLWSGIGLWDLAARRRTRTSRRAVLSAAALPLLLNWRAIDRRRFPDRVLPETLGRSLLASSPSRAVLVLEGDNDSYASWFAQQVLGLRRDVVTVTIPLLGADWYRAELGRRYGVLDGRTIDSWQGLDATLMALARGAERTGRPLSAAASVAARERSMMPGSWRLQGLVYVNSKEVPLGAPLGIDMVKTSAVAESIAARGISFSTGPAREGTGRYVQRLLLCPAVALATHHREVATRSELLETICNYK